MGKFSDKFLGAFNIKDEDDDYEDDYEYEDDFIEDDDFYEEEAYDEPAPKKEGLFFDKKAKSAPKPVKQMAPVASSNNRLSQHEVCVFKPSSIEDSREITETLLQGKAVIINFEGLHVEISQRIIDFICGSCYAIDGNLQKISNYIFIATPDSIDISGDFQNLIGGDDGSFDFSGFKSPLL